MMRFFGFGKSKQQIIKSPLTGNIVKLEDVPDEVFSQKIVGDGIAIDPKGEWLTAPVTGTIVKLFSTKHAMGIVTKEGLEVLIHLGIDTVELKGEGFEAVVEEGQQVNVGDKLIKINWEDIKGKVPSILSPIVITNMDKVESIEILKDNNINSGEDLLSIKLKK